MKKLTLFALLIAFSCINTYAHLTEIKGIFYRFSGSEAIVTYKSFEYGNEEGGTDMDGPDEFSNEYSGKIVIPQSVKYKGRTYRVTMIDDCAFYDCSGVTSVTLPNSITYIGNGAFSDCTNLSNITVGNAVKYVGWGILDGTKWQKKQPNGILYLGKYCLGYKGSQPEGILKIKAGTTVIAGQAFGSCEDITSIEIPNTLITIGAYAFSGCHDIQSITFPFSMKNISVNAFYDCSQLQSVVIRNPKTQIEYGAFGSCNNLRSIKLGEKSLSKSKIQEMTEEGAVA